MSGKHLVSRQHCVRSLTGGSIIATILVGLLNLGRMTTGAVFLYTLFANAFFLVRCLASSYLSTNTLIL